MPYRPIARPERIGDRAIEREVEGNQVLFEELSSRCITFRLVSNLLIELRLLIKSERMMTGWVIWQVNINCLQLFKRRRHLDASWVKMKRSSCAHFWLSDRT